MAEVCLCQRALQDGLLIKAFFRWLNTAGVIIVDPAESPPKTISQPLPIVLTDEEVEKVLEVANSKIKTKTRYPDHTLLLFLLETGVKKVKMECSLITLI